MLKHPKIKHYALLMLLLLLANPAYAERLEIAADAHAGLHLAAWLVLYTHIIAGALGLLTGLVAVLVKKGSKVHRLSGRYFFYAMFACYAVAVVVAPFLNTGQRPNFIAAVLALYLLLSGLQAAKLKPFVKNTYTLWGLLLSFGVMAMGFLFMYQGSQNETGTVDGSPPDAFVVFIVAGAVAFVGEVRVFIAGSLNETARIQRHLWRMCFSFFIASGSLFFGQAQLFPNWFNNTLLPAFFAAFPLFVLIFWSGKMQIERFKRRRVKNAKPAHR